MGKSLLIAAISLLLLGSGCKEKWEPAVDRQKQNTPNKQEPRKAPLKERVAKSLAEIEEIR